MTGPTDPSAVVRDSWDLTLLGRMRAGEEPSAQQLEEARHQLLDRMSDSSQRRRPNRHRRLVPAALVAVSVVLVALMAPALIGRFWPTGGATAQAASLLNLAADHTIHSVDAHLRPGQWLRVTTVGRYQSNNGPQSDVQRAQFWIPYDRSGDWYLHRTDFGTTTPDVVASQGAFYGPLAGTWQAPTPAFLASLPRDTTQLRAVLYKDATGGHSKDGEAVVTVADLLRTGTVPADLRAALYRVLATIPGVEVTQRQITLDGSRGVAFGRYEPAINETQMLIIDPKTGQYIGEKYVTDGRVTSTASFTYTVVNHVPQSVLADAQHTYWKP